MVRGLAGALATDRDPAEHGIDPRSSVASGRVLLYRPPEGVLGLALARALHDADDLDVIFSSDED